MNGTPSNERLSAWLDDELPLDERAEVEKLLAESPELRQEVDELRRLSERLKGLPAESAPAELQPAIMRSIERETLLAGDDSASTARHGRRIRSLTTAAGIALVAGAGLWFATNDNQQNPVQPEIVHVEQTPTTSLGNKSDLRHEVPASLQFNIDQKTLTAADIGDIVEAVRRDGDSVSIVRLTVVDREAGLESLRVLLAHEDILLDGSKDASAAGNDLNSRGLVAVFVESKSDQLSRTIEQMAQRLELEALSVSEALPIAKLDSGLRSKLGLADSSEESRASRAVSVPKSSALEKIIAEPGSYSSGSEASSKPTSKDRPVRVIFVLSNAPENQPVDNATKPENGAA
jgi:hypothetical protein